MRTTLSLDVDVATRLKAEVRRSGKPFKEVVNDCLRLALTSRRRDRHSEPPFEVRPRDLGSLTRRHLRETLRAIRVVQQRVDESWVRRLDG